MAHRALGESSSIKGSPGDAKRAVLHVSTEDWRAPGLAAIRQLPVSRARVSYSARSERPTAARVRGCPRMPSGRTGGHAAQCTNG